MEEAFCPAVVFTRPAHFHAPGFPVATDLSAVQLMHVPGSGLAYSTLLTAVQGPSQLVLDETAAPVLLKVSATYILTSQCQLYQANATKSTYGLELRSLDNNDVGHFEIAILTLKQSYKIKVICMCALHWNWF